MDTLQKKSATPLPQQLYHILSSRISSGHYSAGNKLDSVRTLAGEFHISTLVVNQALELLERAQLILRKPARGVFVTTRKNLNKKLLRVILVFPEPAISEDVLNLSDLHSDTEIYNGMLKVASLENVQVQFQYFPETVDEFELEEQLQQLNGYDAAVFFGDQRKRLRLRAKEFVPILIHLPLGHALGTGESVVINFSQEESLEILADFMVSHGYRNYVSLSWESPEESVQNFFQWRVERLQTELTRRGSSVVQAGNVMLSADQARNRKQLVDFFAHTRTDFIFDNNSNNLSFLYDVLYSAGLRVGQDTDVIYIGASSIFPACSSVALPFFQMGRVVIEQIIAIGRGQQSFTPETIVLPVKIHLGSSTRNSGI